MYICSLLLELYIFPFSSLPSSFISPFLSQVSATELTRAELFRLFLFCDCTKSPSVLSFLNSDTDPYTSCTLYCFSIIVAVCMRTRGMCVCWLTHWIIHNINTLDHTQHTHTGSYTTYTHWIIHNIHTLDHTQHTHIESLPEYSKMIFKLSSWSVHLFLYRITYQLCLFCSVCFSVLQCSPPIPVWIPHSPLWGTTD